MRILSIFLLVFGSLLLFYAVFSRFYGTPSIALHQFRSLSFLMLANTLLTFSLIVLHLNRYFK
jgi:hypothetical protein